MIKQYEIPLLNDHHNHVSFYLSLDNCLDLRNISNIDNAIGMIRRLNDDINIVIGWKFSQNYRGEIEELPPVIIVDGSMHNFIFNNKAKKILKGRFSLIVDNIENKEWVEHNLNIIIKMITQIMVFDRNRSVFHNYTDAFRLTQDTDLLVIETGVPIDEKCVHNFFNNMLLKHQIYRMEDMLLPGYEFIDLYDKAGYSDRIKYWVDIDSYEQFPERYKNKISGIKIFLDGVIGTKTSALNGYLNSLNNGGFSLYTDEKLAETLFYIKKLGLPVAVHALGEIVIAQLLNVIEEFGIKLVELRIEHAQFITKEMADRCKKLNIILSMQPNFSNESITFKDILAEDYLKRNNPFRMLIDSVGFEPGKDLIFGSDGMPHGAKAALENALFPVYPSQKLSLDEFIKGYCLDNCDHGKIIFEVYNESIINLKTIINN